MVIPLLGFLHTLTAVLRPSLAAVRPRRIPHPLAAHLTSLHHEYCSGSSSTPHCSVLLPTATLTVRSGRQRFPHTHAWVWLCYLTVQSTDCARQLLPHTHMRDGNDEWCMFPPFRMRLHLKPCAEPRCTRVGGWDSALGMLGCGVWPLSFSKTKFQRSLGTSLTSTLLVCWRTLGHADYCCNVTNINIKCSLAKSVGFAVATNRHVRTHQAASHVYEAFVCIESFFEGQATVPCE